MMPRKLSPEFLYNEYLRVHQNEYDYKDVDVTTLKTGDTITINCKTHGPFDLNETKHRQGRGCPKCSKEEQNESQRIQPSELMKLIKSIHGNTYTYDNIVKSGHQILSIYCDTHGQFKQHSSKHIKGSKCPKCSRSIRLTHDEYMDLLPPHFKDEYDYSKANVDEQYPKITVICDVHGEFNPHINNHIRGHKCPKCAKIVSTKNAGIKQRLKPNTLIERILERAADIYCLGEIDTIKTTYISHRINVTCREHGEFEADANRFTICPKCHRGSKGEYHIQQYLESINEDYIKEYRFDGCRSKQPLPFDFFLPQYNICIEFDGEQHFTTSKFFGGEQGLKERRRRDNIKTTYCLDNNISLIRIKYNQIDCVDDIIDYVLYHQ